MQRKAAKKIMFTSGKGGVGKSTLALTLAKLLAADGDRVLLIDFDIALRTLDIMLGVSDLVVYDLYDVTEELCEPSAAVLKCGKLDLLAAPNRKPLLLKRDINRLMSCYEKQYDYIILDSPAGVGEIPELLLCTADIAIVVSTPDSVCVHSAAVAASQIAEAGVKGRLLINRFRKNLSAGGRALRADDLMDETSLQLIGIVPEDLYLSLSLLNGEAPDRNLKSVRAMARVAERLKGNYVKLKLN